MPPIGATPYAWVRRTRERLFNHLEQLPLATYTATVPALGTQSTRGLCVHVAAQNYLGWIGVYALGDPEIQRDPAMYPDVAALRDLYAQVDATVARFLERFAAAPDRVVDGRASWVSQPMRVSARWLLMDAMTHAFHHKGQIVKRSRLLGHPVASETDLAYPTPGEVIEP